MSHLGNGDQSSTEFGAQNSREPIRADFFRGNKHAGTNTGKKTEALTKTSSAKDQKEVFLSKLPEKSLPGQTPPLELFPSDFFILPKISPKGLRKRETTEQKFLLKTEKNI